MHLLIQATQGHGRTFLRVFLLALMGCCAACTDPGPSDEKLAAVGFKNWLADAEAGIREGCHGLGMLKHSEFTCAELMRYAARGDPASRVIRVAQPKDCFADV